LLVFSQCCLSRLTVQQRHAQTLLKQGALAVDTVELFGELAVLGLIFLEFFLQRRQLFRCDPVLNQQPLIIPMQLSDLILTHHGALLGLA